MQFTSEQQRVIDHRDGHLQVIACAGSGKTEVIARRIAMLVDPAGVAVSPNGIVAFTFTEKAALELGERVRGRALERAGGPVLALGELYVGTIHGYCLDFLKEEVPEYLRYEVLDDIRQTLLIDRHSKASGLTASSTLDGKPLKRYVDTALYKNALAVLREADVDDDMLDGNSIASNLAAYRALLKDKGYLDYSAMIEATVDALENDPDIRARVAVRVRHVVVDEYQDVNPIQERLVRAFADLGACICVVGDDDQTIYQWRGGDVQNIIGFAERYPGVTSVRLQDNFRSAARVVDTARDFAATIGNRLDKSMLAAGESGEEGDVAALAFDDPDAEAAFIVDRVQALRGTPWRDKGGTERGLCYSDMAVLLRSVKNDAAPIRDAFERAGVPSIVVGLNDLFEARETEAARQLFHFLAGRLDVDEPALEAVWRSADLGLDDDSLNEALASARRGRQAILDQDGQRHAVYNLQRAFMNFLEAAKLRERAIGDRGELVYANLGRFSRLISDFETIHFHTGPASKYESFSRFLEHGAQSAYGQGETVEASLVVDAVRIMTVHQSKGLEWPAVFLPALRRNRFPAKRPGGRHLWHVLPEAAVQRSERYRGEPDDEKRLFYVAMTRSQRFLHASWSPLPGNRNQQRASDFWTNLHDSAHVSEQPADLTDRPRLRATPRVEQAPMKLSFTELKYLLE